MTTTTFYSPGTWTCPSGVQYVDLVVQGAGGGGRAGIGGSGTGGDGGKGGTTTTVAKVAVTAGTSYSIVVGYGGSGGTDGPSPDGSNGGSSTALGYTGAGGAGATNISGSAYGNDGTGTGHGTGGSPPGGAGTNATGYDGGGGGGGAAYFTGGGTGGKGGDGAQGKVTITYVLPTVAFSGSGTGSTDPPAGSKPMTVAWTNTTTNGTTFSWSFPGAGTTAQSVEDPVNSVYSTSGTYDVTLTAYNAYGWATLLKSGYVTVYGVPFAQCCIIGSDHHRGR